MNLIYLVDADGVVDEVYTKLLNYDGLVFLEKPHTLHFFLSFAI